jgi:uncharacterized Fe-S cluster-containing radical SAM superfamily enzyme
VGDRFFTALALARRCNVTTAMLTGKGEPTLWPDEISQYLTNMKNEFPIVELQTNGISLEKIGAEKLKYWNMNGLSVICLSVVSTDYGKNQEVYGKNHYVLSERVDWLHQLGFSVRLICIMAKGYVDDVDSVRKFIDWAKYHKVEQVSLMPVSKPQKTGHEHDLKTFDWVDSHTVGMKSLDAIAADFKKNGSPIRQLEHGAVVYDYDGQNVCLNHCLRSPNDLGVIRNLIFDGEHLRHDWRFEGAILI